MQKVSQKFLKDISTHHRLIAGEKLKNAEAEAATSVQLNTNKEVTSLPFNRKRTTSECAQKQL